MSVKRIYLVVEGDTEERFAKALLTGHLVARGVELKPIIVRKKGNPGGNKWVYVEQTLVGLMKEDKCDDAAFTTLFDLYGLTKFPGLPEAKKIPEPEKRAEAIEEAMQEAIPDRRFHPYLQCHEVEAFVFVDLDAFRARLDDSKDLKRLDQLIKNVAHLDPEKINDGPTTHPSKRLADCMPRPTSRGTAYSKTVYGEGITKAIGLERIRARCPRFHAWVASLESLSPS